MMATYNDETVERLVTKLLQSCGDATIPLLEKISEVSTDPDYKDLRYCMVIFPAGILWTIEHAASAQMRRIKRLPGTC